MLTRIRNLTVLWRIAFVECTVRHLLWTFARTMGSTLLQVLKITVDLTCCLFVFARAQCQLQQLLQQL